MSGARVPGTSANGRVEPPSIKRVPYTEAGRAARQAFERARQRRCTLRQHVVVEAVVCETATYSRLTAHVRLARLADKTLIDVDAVADELKILRGHGIVIYEPGRGRGQVSLVGLPRWDERGVGATPGSEDVDSDEDSAGGNVSPDAPAAREPREKGGAAWAEKGGALDPPPYEKTLREETKASGGNAADALPEGHVWGCCFNLLWEWGADEDEGAVVHAMRTILAEVREEYGDVYGDERHALTEIPRRIAVYEERRGWNPDAVLTATALAVHWCDLTPSALGLDRPAVLVSEDAVPACEVASP